MDILITLSMQDVSRYEIAQKIIAHRISEEEARKLLRLKSTRQVRRIKRRVLKEGLRGVIHKNRWRTSNRKLPTEQTNKIIQLIKKHYHDFKPTFATEKLLEKHNIKISSETLRQLMIKEKLWKPKKRKQPKNIHTWRKRKDNYWEMDQFDGSYHAWLEDRNGWEKFCLLLAIDDATGKIPHAKFTDNEGVKAVFDFRTEYIYKNGIPQSIYHDKFSTYYNVHPSAKDNTELMTQFQRAANQTGIQLITSHSPQSKGRVERVFGTLQDRLVKEMRLRWINTMEEANAFLPHYIRSFNKKFAVAPQNKANLHRHPHKKFKTQLLQIFSIQSQRIVHNDHTIHFKNNFYQLEKQQSTAVFKKDKVTIEEHLNGDIKISFKNHYLKYQVLSERPKKEKKNHFYSSIKKQLKHIPAADHPWRKWFKQYPCKNSPSPKYLVQY